MNANQHVIPPKGICLSNVLSSLIMRGLKTHIYQTPTMDQAHFINKVNLCCILYPCSLKKYLWTICIEPGTVLGTEDPTEIRKKKKKSDPPLMGSAAK